MEQELFTRRNTSTYTAKGSNRVCRFPGNTHLNTYRYRVSSCYSNSAVRLHIQSYICCNVRSQQRKAMMVKKKRRKMVEKAGIAAANLS